MAYNKNSKYLRNAQQSEKDKDEQESEGKKKQPTYRSSVMTPKRARELAEAEAAAALAEEDSTEPTEAAPKAEEEKKAEKASAPYKKEYRSSVLTPKRAKELIAEDTGTAEPEEEPMTEQPERRKGSSEGLFTGKAGSQAQTRAYDRASAKETNKNARHSAIVRMVIAVAVFGALSVALLLFGKIPVPFMPDKFFTVDFSTVPELIVTIAYGPLLGVAISLVKNLASILLMPTSWITSMNNLILDCIYLFATSMLYTRMMKAKHKQLKRGSRLRHYDPGKLFLSSLAGTVISLVPQFLITRFVAYPLMEYFYKGQFSIENTLVIYQQGMTNFKGHLPAEMAAHLPDITNISQGIGWINLPVTFFKLMMVTLATLLVLSLMLPFLQYRDKKAKQNITRTH